MKDIDVEDEEILDPSAYACIRGGKTLADRYITLAAAHSRTQTRWVNALDDCSKAREQLHAAWEEIHRLQIVNRRLRARLDRLQQ